MEDHTNMAVKKTPKTATRAAANAAPRAAKKTVAATGAKAGADYGEAVTTAQAQVEQTVALAKQNVEKASKAAFKGYDQFAVLGQDNFEAFVQSNSVVAKGFELIGKQVMAFAQRSVEGNVAQARALMSARDLQEMLDLQKGFAKQRLEETLAETAKLTELSTQVANEAIEPLQRRVDATVETVFKAQAA